MPFRYAAIGLAIAALGINIAGNAGQSHRGPGRRDDNRIGRVILRPVSGKTLVGVYEPQRSLTITRFERSVGKEVAVVHAFQAWDSPQADFDASWVRWAESLNKRGQVPMITWEPWKYSQTDFDQPKFRLRKIAGGTHDAYIKKWLAAVRDYKKPILVRFAHEMNGNWYPWGRHVNSPRDYIAAWRHIVRLSRERGADNITWVWTPNVDADRNVLQKYYPGRRYVDWVGVSGFNWGGPGTGWAGWRDFPEIFGAQLKWLKAYRKPIIIAEIGSIENGQPHPPAQKTKAAWIKKTFKQIKNSDPPVALVVWQNAVFQSKYDWRASTSPQSLRAMKEALSDSFFSAKFNSKR